LLPSLRFRVRQKPRQHRYRFVGFMGEEQRMMGSKYYLEHLPKEQRARIRAMINLDSLGLGTTEVWVTHADDTRVRVLNGAQTLCTCRSAE
jgi:Zn-dependent M28 family amino/carboxypeptidase